MFSLLNFLSMSKIKITTDASSIAKEEWQGLIHESPSANFFQTPQAYEFFKESGVGEPYLCAAFEENKLVGLFICVVFKEKGLKSYFSRRAICFGGPVLADTISDDALIALLQKSIAVLRKHAIYIEIRNFSDYSNFKRIFESAGFAYRPHLNFHVDCTDEQLMKKRVSSSRMRQVRKSLKEGAEIVEATSVEQVSAFYRILNTLYETKVKTPLFPERFFIRFFEHGVGKYLLVHYKGNIIGGIMCPILESRVIYEWYVCGQDREYKNIYPSVLATWAAMHYANKNGIPRFDFMGAGRPDDDYGVRDFKEKFGGDLVEHGRFVYICKPWLYKLGTFAVSLLKRKK